MERLEACGPLALGSLCGPMVRSVAGCYCFVPTAPCFICGLFAGMGKCPKPVPVEKWELKIA